jgi:hypothetical protein
MEVGDENVYLKALFNPVTLKSQLLLVTSVHCLSSHKKLRECLNANARNESAWKKPCLN